MTATLTLQEIQSQIKTLPNRSPFMLAQDLASLYMTQVKRINEAVKRNPKRFPQDFCFKLKNDEVKILRSQTATAISKMARTNPYGFTREGANMLSTVLHTDIAIERSIQIMRAFSALEELKAHPLESLSSTIAEILKNQEQSLLESRQSAQDLKLLTERVSVLETQINAVMSVRNSFNEKHWLFGKFVEVIAEGIEQNRDEIASLTSQFEQFSKETEAPARKKREGKGKSKPKIKASVKAKEKAKTSKTKR